MSVFGAYAPVPKKFYWKSAQKSNAEVLKNFFYQLRADLSEKAVAVSLDNASIHGCRYITDFIAKYPEIQLFPLPKYTPEYNPTEQVWRWLKPLVHGTRTIENGCEGILQRIRRIMAAWINQRLAKLPQIGVGVWQSLLFDYL